MKRLTAQQSKVLSAIKTYIEMHGIPPTRSEIADTLDIHPTSAGRAVKALSDKGYLVITPHKYRGIELTNNAAPDNKNVLEESRRILFAAMDLRDSALLSKPEGTVPAGTVKKHVETISAAVNKLLSLISVNHAGARRQDVNDGKETNVCEFKLRA